MEHLKALTEYEATMFLASQTKRTSPGFQIGGKNGSFTEWISHLDSVLVNYAGPLTSGNSLRTGGNDVYPGGLNTETYLHLLDRNPVFTTGL